MASDPAFRELGLTWLFSIGTPTQPTAYYISFHTSDPGTTGAGEATTVFATRTQQAAWTADQVDDGNIKNSGAGTTPLAANTTNPTNFTHFGIWDSATPGAGNYYCGGALTGAPIALSDNEKFTWADKQLTVDIT